MYDSCNFSCFTGFIWRVTSSQVDDKSLLYNYSNIIVWLFISTFPFPAFQASYQLRIYSLTSLTPSKSNPLTTSTVSSPSLTRLSQQCSTYYTTSHKRLAIEVSNRFTRPVDGSLSRCSKTSITPSCWYCDLRLNSEVLWSQNSPVYAPLVCLASSQDPKFFSDDDIHGMQPSTSPFTSAQSANTWRRNPSSNLTRRRATPSLLRTDTRPPVRVSLAAELPHPPNLAAQWPVNGQTTSD